MDDALPPGTLLVAELAHEIKNIFMVVRSSITLLRQDLPQGGCSVDVLDDLLDASDRAVGLAHRLMDLARRSVEDRRPSDLAALLGWQVETLRRLAPPGVTIDVRIEPTHLRAALPLRDVEQVLLNLALNAFDAMPAGGTLTIEVRRAPLVGDPGFACLSVRDTGAGMDPAVLARAFEPFFTTKAKVSGTGLGLATVRETVERRGGRVAIESQPEQGTTVTLYLPLSDDAPGDKP